MGCNNAKIVPFSGNRPITIALLGLDHAGKTTTAKVLEKTSVDDVTPTVGFAQYEVQHRSRKITLYDLGGSKNFRDAWRHFYDDCYGFIYIIEYSQENRFDENREVFQRLLREEKIQNKSILILVNRHDHVGALDKKNVLQQLGIEQILQENPNLYRVEICTAKLPSENGRQPRIDPAIQSGFDWLVRTIHENSTTLYPRVEHDVRIRDEAEKEAKRKRREQRDKLREEQGNENDEADHAPTNGFIPIGQAIKNADKNSTSHTNDDIEETRF